MKNDYYAHSGDKSDFSDWQPLRDHLHEVAKLARHFAEAACPNDPVLADAAFAAGLLHDLGKYRVEFQQMIRKIPVQKEKTWHKQAGAATAAFANAEPSAFAIAGHHGGIPNKADLISSVKGESGKAVADAVWPNAVVDCPEFARLTLQPPPITDQLICDVFTDRLAALCLKYEQPITPDLKPPEHEFANLVNELGRSLMAEELFTFVLVEGVEATNNLMERELRNPAGDRNAGRTNKTTAGAHRRSVIVSVLESLRANLETFTLANVLAEVQRWMDKGISLFAEQWQKIKDAQPAPTPNTS